MPLDRSDQKITDALLAEVRACTRCAVHLGQAPRPVLQLHSEARILVAGQAPGRRVHQTGIPFNDPSGDRLRNWMGIDRETFYDARRIALIPMGLCYPGTGKSGDLPPRPECAVAWRSKLLARLPNIELTLAVGQYAVEWHFADNKKSTLTERVLAWRENWPRAVPAPHPSPRNNMWLRRNRWFEDEVVPAVRQRIQEILR